MLVIEFSRKFSFMINVRNYTFTCVTTFAYERKLTDQKEFVVRERLRDGNRKDFVIYNSYMKATIK